MAHINTGVDLVLATKLVYLDASVDGTWEISHEWSCSSSWKDVRTGIMFTSLIRPNDLITTSQTHWHVIMKTCYNLVTTWMGDCSRAGKPSGYITSHLGRLSLLTSVGW